MYKNYIFDLYGTLLDIRTNENKPYLWKKMSEIYSALGAEYTAVELKSAFRTLERQLADDLPENGEPELVLTGLEQYFDGIMISSEVGYKKPAPEFYGCLFRKFDLKPEESLMVGNDETSDIAGAVRVGMDSLYIHTEISPRTLVQGLATYRVMDGDWLKVAKLLREL